MAKTVIESLVAQLGFEFNDKDLKRYNRGMRSATRAALSTIAAFTGVAISIRGIVNSALNVDDSLLKAAEKLDITTAAIQEMTFAAEINGASSQGMISALELMTKHASEASRGLGKTVEVFGMLGVSVVNASGQLKKADTLFLEVADSIGQIADQGRRLELGRKLGFSDDLIISLHKGGNQFRALRQEAQALGTVFAEDSPKITAKYVDALIRVRKVIAGVSNIIATKLQKAMIPIMTAFTNWVRLNRALIKQRLEATFTFIGKSLRVVAVVGGRVKQVLDRVIQGFGGLQNVMKIAVGGFLAMNATALLFPVVIAGAVAAIFLLVEDMQKFSEGGDSAIQSLIDKVPELEAPIRALVGTFALIGKGWGLIFSEGGDAFEGAILMVRDMFSWLDKIFNRIKDIGVAFKEMFKDTAFEKFNALYQKLIGGVAFGAPEASTPTGPKFYPIPQRQNFNIPFRPGATQTPSGKVNTSNDNSTKNITFNVTGENPIDITAQISDMLTKEFGIVGDNFQTAVEF